MSRKKLLVVISIILVLLILLFKVTFIDKNKKEQCDNTLPTLALSGESNLKLKLNEPYVEKGYWAKDKNGKDISSKVVIEGEVDNKTIGTYEIKYEVIDDCGNKSYQIRTINVYDNSPSYKTSYNDIDNTKNGWWSGNKSDESRPTGGADLEELKKYNAYFMGNDEKKIYLTFDEGSNDTYVDQIIDVLNKNNVQATFFLCGNYVVNNPDVIRKMVKGGHSVGNHTYHHRNMPSYATAEGFNEYLKEITLLEDAYREITGKDMDKVYREPKGEWSYRSLQIMKDLGYKTFFWSADYLDFDGEKTKEYALEMLLKKRHNGAIYLIHPKTKGNYEALDDFIKELKKMGYSFGLVKDIK